MPPPPHQKPENVLKRAQELDDVGQTSAALSSLYDFIIAKRSRSVPVASLEPVMLRLVELSVEQKKGKIAKDALYQYKNISQNTNIGTIELVLKTFIQLAADKVISAQQKADEVQSSLEATTDTGNVDDLEASETPESILLATVSGEQSKDRTDRAIVTPWLKFLWEAYRTVLDILRNNARLEILYQSTAMQAFDFCLKYSRKTEFRRLCELLRNHLQTAAKYSSQMHAINLNEPDTLQRHLETRFQQLNVAVELELWQEAFRSVEDIHTLLNMAKRPPKNIMMANYYEKLTRIFLVGENYLFHAAAWSRYYNLLRQSAALVASSQGKKADNPSTTEADLERAASSVLLSSLAIPVISTSRSRGAMVDFDDARKGKNSRLTHLLGMSQAPSRAILLQDALSKQLHRRARPEIRELYNILEVDFHPLSICRKISPILSKIGTDAEMEKYIAPLQQVILTRLFQQLSQVYDTVDLSFVLNLASFPEPFEVTRSTVEKFIMNGNKKGDLAIRIDHSTSVLSFDADVFSSSKAAQTGATSGSAESDVGTVQRLQSTPSEIVRSQLSRLAKSLYTTVCYIDPSFNKKRLQAQETALSRAKAEAEKEHLEILGRKVIIQKRKDKLSELQAQRDKENSKRKMLQEQALQQAEANRLLEEQRVREQKRMAAEREAIRRQEVETMLKELRLGPNAVDLEGEDLDSLDSNRIRMIKLQQLEKAKNSVNEKLRIAGKRIDHLERAFRKEEVKKMAEDYEEQRARDLAAYERMKTQTLEDSKRKHAESVELKHRLSRLMPFYESFRENLHERRRDEFEKRRRDAEREMEKQIAARKKAHRDQKLRERKEAEEAERLLREKEEQAAKEKAERAARDEAKKQELARQKAQREAERQETLERAAQQMRREEEALARRKAEKAQQAFKPTARAEAPSSDTPATTEPLPPRINLPGAGKWREKEAEKQQAYRPSARAEAPASSSNSVPSAETAPPRINVPGAGKSWREKEAEKAKAQALGNGPSASPAESKTPEPVVDSKPKPGKYVPPGRRG